MRDKLVSGENVAEIKKSDWLLIGCSWLLVQMIILYWLGINDGEESTKYIDLANKWTSGVRHFNWYNLFYSGYTGMHVLLRIAGFPPKGMYVVQLLLSALAQYYFVQILRLFIRSRIAIVASGILYAFCFIIQQWVDALFTDSAFSSLLIIATYFLLAEEKGLGKKIAFWTLLIILPSIRPVGFLFIILACFYWLLLSTRKNTGKLVICLVYLFLIAVVMNKSLAQSPGYFYPLHNIQANVICGYPGNLLQYQKVPYQEGMSIFSYLMHNPGMSVRLFFSRFLKIFIMSRAYFSPMHNLLLTISTIVYYILAITGMLRIFFRKEREKYFLFAGILLFSIPSVVFCVDWSGRFSLPVLCFVLLLSAMGIDRIWEFIRISNSSTPAPRGGPQ